MAAEQFRRDRIASLVDLTDGVGLEIGPLDRAFALRPESDVRYVDVRSTEEIRKHYADDVNVDCAAIVDIDFTLYDETGEIRSLAKAAKRDAPYRWVIASHVIEHVPDLVGWLADIAELLDDDGRLALIVPDRRFTFDVIRPPTTVGELLQAHLSHDAVPSVRAVYDYTRSIVHADAGTLWSGFPADPDDRYYTREEALANAERAARNEYVDSHVWTFTPSEFVQQLDELSSIGKCDFVIESVVPTMRNELEFSVALRRIPRTASSEEADALRRSSVRTLETTELPTEAAPEPAPNPGFAITPREVRLIRLKRRVVAPIRARLRRS